MADPETMTADSYRDAYRRQAAHIESLEKQLIEGNNAYKLLEQQIEVKNAALIRASSIFMEYAHHHFAKGTEDGDKKAKKNRALAAVMQEALK